MEQVNWWAVLLPTVLTLVVAGVVGVVRYRRKQGEARQAEAEARRAEVSAVFDLLPTSSGHGLFLVVTNSGPAEAGDVQAEMVTIPLPMLHQPDGTAGRDLLASASFTVPVITMAEAPQQADVRLSWEDDSGRRQRELTLSLPA